MGAFKPNFGAAKQDEKTPEGVFVDRLLSEIDAKLLKRGKPASASNDAKSAKPVPPSLELTFCKEIAENDDVLRGRDDGLFSDDDSDEARNDDADDAQFYKWNGTYWSALGFAEYIQMSYAHIERVKPSALSEKKAMSLCATALSYLNVREKHIPRQVGKTLIPLRNAVLELRDDGVILAHQPDRKFGLTFSIKANLDWSRVVDGVYTPASLDASSEFAQYLCKVQPDPAMRDALGEGLAASLTTHNWQKALWLIGSGGNGKSTILELISSLHSHPASFLLDRIDSEFATEQLMKTSLVVVPEAPERHINEARFKQWISRDPIPVNRKHLKEITIRPRAFWVISMNKVMQFRDASTGMLRRIYAIPFNQQLHGQGQILDFHKRILRSPDEMSVLLDYLLTSASRLVQRGRLLEVHELPPAVVATFNTIREASDSAFDYMQRHDVGVKPNHWCDKQEVYDAYRLFCDRAGIGALRDTNFWQRLRDEIARRGDELVEKRTKRDETGQRGRVVNLSVEGVRRIAYTPPPEATRREEPLELWGPEAIKF